MVAGIATCFDRLFIVDRNWIEIIELNEMALDDSDVTGYIDPLVSFPGDKPAVKVSCSRGTFTSQLFRLRAGYHHPDAPPVSHHLIESVAKQTHQGQPQFSRIGSCARINSWIGSSLEGVDSVSIRLWCQATLPLGAKHDQFLFSSVDNEHSTGFECLLDESSNLILRVGGASHLQESAFSVKLVRERWYHLDFNIRPFARLVSLKAFAKARDLGEPSTLVEEEHYLRQATRIASSKPLVIASDSRGCEPSGQPIKSGSFNGKIDSLKIEIVSKGSLLTLLDLDFSLGIPTDTIQDRSHNKHHGELINAPSRAVTGHDWDPSLSDWTRASHGYGAIHFHDDDLDDAMWSTTFNLELPKSLRSGCYGVSVDDGKSTDFIPFFIRPDPNAQLVPPVALIIPTFTYAGKNGVLTCSL